jgi:hypothetical protein
MLQTTTPFADNTLLFTVSLEMCLTGLLRGDFFVKIE